MFSIHTNYHWNVYTTDDRCDLLCLNAPRAESTRQKLLDEETGYEALGRANGALGRARAVFGGKCGCPDPHLSLGYTRRILA